MKSKNEFVERRREDNTSTVLDAGVVRAIVVVVAVIGIYFFWAFLPPRDSLSFSLFLRFLFRFLTLFGGEIWVNEPHERCDEKRINKERQKQERIRIYN